MQAEAENSLCEDTVPGDIQRSEFITMVTWGNTKIFLSEELVHLQQVLPPCVQHKEQWLTDTCHCVRQQPVALAVFNVTKTQKVSFRKSSASWRDSAAFSAHKGWHINCGFKQLLRVLHNKNQVMTWSKCLDSWNTTNKLWSYKKIDGCLLMKDIMISSENVS